MKKIYLILYYISLLFLVFYLYNLDYFNIPVINSYGLFTLSLFFLFLGSLIQIFNWKGSLRICNINISNLNSLISHGLSIFMKYVPGKVMVILGRATYISNEYDVKLSKASSASLISQVLAILTGVVFSLFAFVFFDFDYKIKLSAFLVIVVSLLFIVYFNFLRVLIYNIFLFFKKKIFLPKVKAVSFFQILPSFFLSWLLMGIGFFCLTKSIYESTDYMVIFIFPLSMVLGIVSIFAPGGIGVREGVLLFLFLKIGIPEEMAISISVFSRLWFLSGEIFMFILAVLFKYLNFRK